MTVRELIAELQGLNQDLRVVIADQATGSELDIDSVEESGAEPFVVALFAKED